MREDHLKVIVQFVEEGEVMEEWFGQGEADEDEQEDEEEEEADEEQEDGKDIATAIPSAVSTQTRKPSTPRERAEKAIGMSKACMMKVLVEICGECTMSVKESWFQTKLLRWIESASKSESENLSESKGKGKAVDGNRERGTEQGLERDDLLCCGLLCMGNSARSGTYARACKQTDSMDCSERTLLTYMPIQNQSHQPFSHFSSPLSYPFSDHLPIPKSNTPSSDC